MDREMLRWIEGLIRQDKLVKFYQCREWRKLRLEALERDHYECQICKRKGKYRRAQNVHHIKEVKSRPDLALTLDNLESVCIKCHNEIHKKEYNLKSKQKPFVNIERW